ncbi:RND transporter [Cupriavidus necator]|uniref:efflux RND transporter permease subunit n=1 Tax=Cupriavidus TaxID=106589 RepID=UPI00032F0AE6|nr:MULTISPECIES: MMPL family transporter [Cupriavidus]EON20793.1 transporter [Cupriavidus sp. GA3-3]KUE86964.1 RND transporter [Cupriavidus necator]
MHEKLSKACQADWQVVQHIQDFDAGSGSVVERLIFNHRAWIVALCVIVTVLLGWQAMRVQLNADFEKMIPAAHPYIQNYLQNKADLSGLGNSVRVAVETRERTIFDAGYLDRLKKINDELFLIPGVDRAYQKSLWTANTRWLGVTEEGLEGGTVIPDDYDGSAQTVEQVRRNVERSGEIGQLVAGNYRSSIIFLPLLERDPRDEQALDYKRFSDALEAVRQKYETRDIRIHVTGFAKVVGDLITGIGEVMVFFALAVAIAAAAVLWYTRCLRSMLLVVLTSLLAVVWQLGLLPLLGYALDPYSVLVPFLVFAIGMSHGAQKMNGIMQDIGRGMHRLVAARYTFRRLFMAGLSALLCDAVGFAVLLVIRIPVIQELAVVASLGVAILIFTNLVLLPVLLSYTGVDANAAARALRSQDTPAQVGGPWRFLERFTTARWALSALLPAAVLGLGGYLVSQHLQVGDLDEGAPELRADSRYNRDDRFMRANYAASSDLLVVMVRTPDGHCADYATLRQVDALEWQLRQLPGVEGTNSLALLARRIVAGMAEGSPKWYELVQNQATLNTAANRSPRESFNQACNLLSLYVYLQDHRAETLARVVSAVEAFAASHDSQHARFMLAAGSAGIEAATNIVVRQASREMLFWVYGAVIVLCMLTFRSWRAAVCAVVPLVLTSVLAEALMVALGLGVKVATLPVIALGVGIGVDYALYIMTIVLAELRAGASLPQAYRCALRFTGKVVMLTGVTLAIAVATWTLSPIKFQADMGVLLAFMFLWNMLGALILLPALAWVLLPEGRAGRSPVPVDAIANGASGARH